jgi:sec-independent protein translocase protein TatB
MFDIGFSEMVVIGLVALIVIGPERLPRVARTLGHLAGRLQRYVADVKADINREVELDELRKMKDSVQQAASGIESSVQSELNSVQNEFTSAENALNAAAASAAAGSEAAAGTATSAEPAAAAEPAKIPEKTS